MGNIVTDSNNNIIYQISTPTQLTLHALLGCAVGVGQGGDCASGATSGVVGELTGIALRDKVYNQNPSLTIDQATQIAGLVGSFSTIFTGNAIGLDDSEVANNMFIGQRVGENAARNNALYVLKDHDLGLLGNHRIVATDQENDHKVILINENERDKIAFKTYIEAYQRGDLDLESVSENKVLIINKDYQDQTTGTFYDLTNPDDFNYLASLTNEISYSPETLDLIFNNNNNNMKTNIFFQNGMDNNYTSANQSASLISQDTARTVGIIVNDSKGKLNDVLEYLPNQLYLKDALNGEVYQQIASNNNKNLVITHSAGNEDIIKAAKVLNLQNVNLNNRIDLISVGSPKSQNELQKYLNPIGINVIGQYNNWLDPVTNSKTWAVGTLSLLTATAIYGASYGASTAASGAMGLEAFFKAGLGGAAGGAAGFGTGLGLLKIQHPFASYYNKDYKNLATDIIDWSKQNPVSATNN